MKECFYCLESIPTSEYICSHCRSWQPSKSEIDDKYFEVIKSLAISRMGWKSLWKSFWMGVIFVVAFQAIFAVLEYQGTASAELLMREWIASVRTSATAVLFAIFSCISLGIMYVKSADHIVTNEIYLIEKSLRDRLKSFQTRSFSEYILAIGIIVIVFSFLR